MLWRTGLYLEPDKNGNTGGANGANSGETNPESGETPPQDFDTWIASQPENVKRLLDSYTSGLKSALKSERESRSALEKQLRDLASKSEKDSEAQKQLTKMADQIAEADRKADFYEAAHSAGITNLKLAYLVALQDELFDRRGQVNFEAMKQNYPELFGTLRKAPQGNAGAGAGGNQTPQASMNDWIRRKAGRS